MTQLKDYKTATECSVIYITQNRFSDFQNVTILYTVCFISPLISGLISEILPGHDNFISSLTQNHY